MNKHSLRRSHSAPQGLDSQRGLSLIEVLITVIIVSVGLLGVAALQATGLQQNHSAYLRTQATNLSYQMLDHARSNRSVLTNGELPDRELWEQRIAALLPGGTLSTFTVTSEFLGSGTLGLIDVNTQVLHVVLALQWVDERDDEPDADGSIEFITRTTI